VGFVAGYTRVQVHEWERQWRSPNFFIWSYVSFRSKYDLDTGPSRWVIEVEFGGRLQLEDVVLGISGSLWYPAQKLSGVRLNLNTNTNRVTISLAEWMTNELPHRNGKKYRIYVAVYLVLGIVTFEYWDEHCAQYLGSERLRTLLGSENSDELYPTGMIMRGSGSRVRIGREGVCTSVCLW
jgi:hypothetical protein